MILLELEDEKIEEIRDILGELYLSQGSTQEVIKLSQWVDNIMVSTQKERQMLYIKINKEMSGI